MKIFKLLLSPLLIWVLFSTLTFANTAKEIISDTNDALATFQKESTHAKELLNNAKGYVVFPDITELGMFVGGKYGEGVLIVNNKIKSFHSITSASIGMTMGVQTYSLIIIFKSDKAIKDFIVDDDWESDDDKRLVIADWSSEDDLDKVDYGSDMIGFAFDSKGMLGKLSMEGTKFEEIDPDED